MRLRLDAAAGGPSCVQFKIRNWRDPGCKYSEFTGRLQAPRRSPPAAGWRTPATPSSPIRLDKLDRWRAARRKGLGAEILEERAVRSRGPINFPLLPR